MDGTIEPSLPRIFRRNVEIKRRHIPRLEWPETRPRAQVVAGLQIVFPLDARTSRNYQGYRAVGPKEDLQREIEDGDGHGRGLDNGAVLTPRSRRQPVTSRLSIRPTL